MDWMRMSSVVCMTPSRAAQERKDRYSDFARRSLEKSDYCGGGGHHAGDAAAKFEKSGEAEGHGVPSLRERQGCSPNQGRMGMI
jgi:hypothetical protein